MSEITINIKSSQDKKYSLTVPLSLTVLEFKQRIAAVSEIEVERQRLIYSGRVLKDPDTLETYKIADGNTIHLVKGAAAAAATSSSASSSVPQNVSTGINPSNPLNAFTSGQYAGHQIPLPPPSLFGPDGGMTFPSSASESASLRQMISDPATMQAMNAMLQDPAMLDMILERSGLGGVPGAREMMRSEGFRRAMLDPGVLGGMMGGQGQGQGQQGRGGFPAPGGVSGEGQQQQGQQGQESTPTSPFAGIFGPGSIFGAGALGAPGAGAGAQANPLAGLMSMFGGAGAGNDAAAGAGAGAGAGANPFANPALLEMLMGGTGMGTASGTGAAEPPADTRPLEERYQTQLGQLNDMGFLDFDRNIAALRRSGGNVQGAIEVLLSGGV
ncbi:hypothetical protein YB2330_001734 [Saitoella coloradoensis]